MNGINDDGSACDRDITFGFDTFGSRAGSGYLDGATVDEHRSLIHSYTFVRCGDGERAAIHLESIVGVHSVGRRRSDDDGATLLVDEVIGSDGVLVLTGYGQLSVTKDNYLSFGEDGTFLVLTIKLRSIAGGIG